VASPATAHAVMERDLVDAYRIMIFPIILGSGRRLFPETPRKTVLRLADTRTLDPGVVVQTYRRVSG